MKQLFLLALSGLHIAMTTEVTLKFTKKYKSVRLYLHWPNVVAGQLGLKSSRPLSQVGPGSTWPESTGPGVFSERSVTYMYMFYTVWALHNLSD